MKPSEYYILLVRKTARGHICAWYYKGVCLDQKHYYDAEQYSTAHFRGVRHLETLVGPIQLEDLIELGLFGAIEFYGRMEACAPEEDT
ncbi:MAG: hypothetical protein PVJ86_02665 [Phycisphaerales bacterium]